ncbi:MAG TPA: FxsA family protein [Methylocella sp.]|nr:FxsA family protein [Methylocella sp.]
MRQQIVRLPVLFVLYLSLWLAAELATFAAVVHWIGFSGAIIACVLTSLAGLATLRRVGLSAALRLRKAMMARSKEDKVLSREAVFDGALAGLGGVLLILPGFVSDLLGLALAAPSFRLWAADQLKFGKHERGKGERAGPVLIELTPREWSRHEELAPREGQEPAP